MTPTPASVTLSWISVSESGSPAVTVNLVVSVVSLFLNVLITGGVVSTEIARVVSVSLVTPSAVALEITSVPSLTTLSGRVITPVF